MKFFREIFGRIWALWGILLFVTTMFIFMIPYLIVRMFAEPVRTHLFIRVSKVWMTLYLYGIACPLRIRGKGNFQTGKNYIVVFNHNSFMDVPLSCPFVPGGNKTIAKKEFARAPVFGLLYKMGSVLVDRKSDKSRRESFQEMKTVLQMGLHMCIYPEGTRNTSAEPLKAFHDGAFRLAIETGVPIIPSLLFNTKKALPVDKGFFLWPQVLKMDFLSPVYIGDGDTIPQLKEKVFRMMRDYYLSHSR